MPEDTRGPRQPESIEVAKRVAFDNAISSINTDVFFPSQVFVEGFSEYKFFESDQIFSPSFAGAINSLLLEDGALVCSLINLSQTRTETYGEAAALFFEAGIAPAEYDARLQAGGPGRGWMFTGDRFCCASDTGSWSIYCEKNNDVAVIGLQDRGTVERLSSGLHKLHAEEIVALLDQGAEAVPPFGILVPRWRYELTRHYGNGRADSPLFENKPEPS
jgi:hypothetical protein